MNSMRDDARIIIDESIKAVLPEAAVSEALKKMEISADLVLVAIGKAAWNMAKAAKDTLGERIKKGIVITKYFHSKGPIESCEIIEAGHPIPDQNSVFGATKVLEMVSGLTNSEQILFIISGGGSALFEKPLDGVSLDDMIGLTNQLLGCGADIVEINTVRKHLSAVKGGRFAQQCGNSKIFAIVLSDVVGDKLDAIASGPSFPDSTTSQEAIHVLRKYNILVGDTIQEALLKETPKVIDNCEAHITGSVTALCNAAAQSAEKLGYSTLVLSTSIGSEAKEYGKYLASIAKEIKKENNSDFPKLPCAIISGGETIVRLTGNGKGGRNQEVALSAALEIEGLENVVIFSVGSDGTDGPTDAAGGMVDGGTTTRMRSKSINPEVYLENNDSYYALRSSDDLILTGPTGTNVNDLMVILCK